MAGVVLLAACNGGSAAPGVASLGSTTTINAATAAAAGGGGVNLQKAYTEELAYSECMRKHGEPNYPDPVLKDHNLQTGGGNIDQNSPTYVKANSTCKKLVPDGGPPTAAQMQQAVAAALKHAECMRAHGVADFPDPVVSGDGVSIRIPFNNSPQFQAAQKTCQKLAPMAAPG